MSGLCPVPVPVTATPCAESASSCDASAPLILGLAIGLGAPMLVIIVILLYRCLRGVVVTATVTPETVVFELRDNSRAPRDANRPIAFLFTDIEKSSKLWSKDSDLMEKIVARHFEILRTVLDRYEIFECKTAGDSIMACSHDAAAAVRAAVEMQQALYEEDWVDSCGAGAATLDKNYRYWIGLEEYVRVGGRAKHSRSLTSRASSGDTNEVGSNSEEHQPHLVLRSVQSTDSENLVASAPAAGSGGLGLGGANSAAVAAALTQSSRRQNTTNNSNNNNNSRLPERSSGSHHSARDGDTDAARHYHSISDRLSQYSNGAGEASHRRRIIGRDTMMPENPAFEGLRVRIGVHYGKAKIIAEMRAGSYDYFSTSVAAASRIEGLGHGGQVLVSSVALDAALKTDEDIADIAKITPLGTFSLRGLTDPYTISQLLPKHLSARCFPPLRLDPTELEIKEALEREAMSDDETISGANESTVSEVHGPGGGGSGTHDVFTCSSSSANAAAVVHIKRSAASSAREDETPIVLAVPLHIVSE